MSDFDITKHEWSDASIIDSNGCDDDVQISSPELQVYLNKADTIALAKHFKLTAEDLL